MATYKIVVYGGPKHGNEYQSKSLVEAALGAGTDLDGVVASYTLRAVFEKGDGKFGDVNRENFS